MKKLRLYIEMRDVQKRQRIKNQRETTGSLPAQKQSVLTPKMMATPSPKMMMTPSQQRGVTRKSRNGEGWSMNDRDMEVEEWEHVHQDQVKHVEEQCVNQEQEISHLRAALMKACMENPTEENKKMLQAMIEK